MIENELLRFMQSLKDEAVPTEVRKIANIVLEHLSEISVIGTAQGRRAAKIADLASKNWHKTSDKIVSKAVKNNANSGTFNLLKSLKVGPFRGFAKEEFFNLEKSRVLIYGPNGTGKSSFCEALEYGLIGSVAEAQNKRFSNQNNYFKNAYVNKFVAPIINGIDSEDKSIVITANEEFYRFCFVEKNRIDSFSRIAAHVPAKQNELIASLFGLDDFNEFVTNFSRDLDNRYIDLVGQKSEQLIKKQQDLDHYKQTINDSQLAIKAQSKDESSLANEYKADLTFLQLVKQLGTTDKPGDIQRIEKDLQKKLPALSKVTLQKLADSKTKVEDTHKELSQKSADLREASEGLSFKQLYGAVIDLEIVSDDKCPACKTPLLQVSKNPYDFARDELVKLEHLVELEKKRDQLHSELIESLNTIYKMLKICIEQVETGGKVNLLEFYSLEIEDSINWEWYQHIVTSVDEQNTGWTILSDQIKELELRDVEINTANKERRPKEVRLDELRQLQQKVIKLQAKREAIETSSQNAKNTIKAFDEDNKKLIEDVEKEKPIIKINNEIVANYKDFVSMLIEYKENLPSKLVSDLGNLVVQLYNSFNRYDVAKDLLSGIKLPTTSGQRIEIAFQNDPQKYFDALHILSEGHIRCIGLAILLAKNIKENSPILIFDDPVNAIDDEHRKAIRETLFKDDYFKNKQIILAIHGNEFFKDVHQLIGKKASEETESYKFLPQEDENHIQVSSLKRPTNYVAAATESLKEAEYRDALMSSRRALENLCYKIWDHYGKYCNKSDGLISVSRRSPESPWDLRHLVENLKSKIKKSKANIPHKENIVEAFEALLGISGQDPCWVYLNKGTHEENDRTEFEHGVVKNIVSTLKNLDACLSSK